RWSPCISARVLATAEQAEHQQTDAKHAERTMFGDHRRRITQQRESGLHGCTVAGAALQAAPPVAFVEFHIRKRNVKAAVIIGTKSKRLSTIPSQFAPLAKRKKTAYTSRAAPE